MTDVYPGPKEIAAEIERRTLRHDIKHSRDTVAALDQKIAALRKQRDKHVEHIGGCKARLRELGGAE